MNRTNIQTAGFTLIEMVVSTALLGVVIFYVMGTFTVNQRAYIVLDQVTEVQQNLRAIAELIERDMRHAGFRVPIGGALCGLDSTTAPDTLYISDPDPLLTTNAINGDVSAGITAVSIGGVVVVATLDDVVIDGTAFYDTDANGIADSDFQVGGGIILTDAVTPTRGAACGVITAIDLGANIITFTRVSGALGAIAFGASEDLRVVPAHEYRIDVPNTQLLRNGMILAMGVEDLQFAVWLDVNDDNAIDPGEYFGDGSSADYTASGTDHGDSREMRVTLVTRTRSADAEFQLGQEQNAENRLAPGGNDGFRRRVHTSTSRLRNVVNRS